MVRFLKYAGIAAAILVGLLALILLAVNTLPGEKFKPLISYGVRTATGRELIIEGDLDIALGSTFAFQAAGIKFANAAWGSRPHMATVDTLAGEVALFPLLKGILDVGIVIDHPDVLLETNTSGRGNWELGAPDAAADNGTREKTETAPKSARNAGLPLRPLIRKIYINDTHFVFSDRNRDTRMTLSGDTLHVSTTGERLTIDITGSFNVIPMEFTGSLDNARFLVDNQATGVQIDGHAGDVKLAVTGTAGPVAPAFDLDLTVAMHTDSIKAFSALAAQDLPDMGPLAMTAELKGREGRYSVEDMQAVLRDDSLSVEINGALKDAVAIEGLKLETRIDTPRLTAVLKKLGLQMEYSLPDVFHVAVAMEGSLSSLAVREFQTTLQGRGIHVDGTAAAKNIMDLEGVSANLSMKAESLDLLADITGMNLPSLGPLNVSTRIVSTGKNLGKMNFRTDIKGEQIQVSAAGSLEDPLELKNVDAEVTLGVTSFAWLVDYLAIKLPPLGPLQASARIASTGDTLSVRDIEANLAGENITLQLAGSVGDVLKVQGVDATADLTVRSLDVLSEYVDTDLSSLGPLKASAAVSADEGRIQIKNFSADLAGQHLAAEMTGSLENVRKLTGIGADFKVAVDSLASLDPLAKRKLPASGPVELKGTLSGEGGLKAPVKIDVSLTSDGVDASLTGSVSDLLNATGIDLGFEVKAESLAKAGKLTGIQSRSPNSVSMTGRLLTDEKTYRLSGFHLSTGKLDTRGDLAYQPPPTPEDRPRVSGRLQIGELDFSERMMAKGDPAAEPVDKTKHPVKKPQKKKGAQKEKVFPADPLPFSLLKSVDAEFEVIAERLVAPQLEMKDFSAKIELDKGLLRLAPVKAGIGKGSLNGALTLDAAESPSRLDIDLRIRDASLRNLSGNINFLADLAGSGDSVAAIMAGLNGLVELDIKNLTLTNSLMTDFGAGFFNFLNPLKKEEETTQLICAVVLFKIEDGIADARRKIVAQMEDVTWIGGGEINLKTEEISLGISPRSRKLLDIDMGELATLGYLGGTLAQPKVEIDPKDIAIKYGKYTAAIFTGGLSLLADQLWRKVGANQHVCDQILQLVDSED